MAPTLLVISQPVQLPRRHDTPPTPTIPERPDLAGAKNLVSSPVGPDQSYGPGPLAAPAASIGKR